MSRCFSPEAGSFDLAAARCSVQTEFSTRTFACGVADDSVPTEFALGLPGSRRGAGSCRGARDSFQNEFPQVIRSTETDQKDTGQMDTGQMDRDNDKSLVAPARKTLLGMSCFLPLSTTSSSG